MKERPILFSADMVRAILDGRKTQTRRVVRPQPEINEKGNLMGEWLSRPLDGLLLPKLHDIAIHCPYGKTGDRLWVRETWGIGSRPDPWGGYDGIEYRADEAWLEDGDDLPCHEVKTPDDVCLGDYRLGWKPSIHMPRWASRLTLEVTNVCVERLQEISTEDCIAEGMSTTLREHDACIALRDDYRKLWDSLNAERGYGWGANPWVWVVEFKRIES